MVLFLSENNDVQWGVQETGALPVGRPKKGSEQATARERIVAAFGELALEYPVPDITVRAVCAAAHCNKTTFYYHFETFEALWDAYLETSRIHEYSFELLTLTMERGWKNVGGEWLWYIEHWLDNFCLLVAHNKDNAFGAKIACYLRRALVRIYGFSQDETDEQALMVEFTLGGIMGVYAYRGRTGNRIPLDAAMEMFYRHIAAALMETCQDFLPNSASDTRSAL